MPRNGSGVYSPTAGIPVVSGTTISSTAVNNVLDDLGDEITASLPVSGVAPMTGVLRVTAGTAGAPGLVPVGDTNTGIYSPGADQLGIATGGVAAVTFSATQTTAWAGKAVGKAFDIDAITDVASASTTDIGAAATSEVNITGTTTITSFGTSNAGIVRRGTFAAALTLTHNGTSLILPGAANITTAAGDSFVARSLGSGNWRVLDYTRAAVVPLAATSATVLLNSGTASAAAVVDITLPTGYRSFRLVIGPGFYPTTDGAVLGARLSFDNGATFSATTYSWATLFTSSAAASSTGGYSSNDAGAWAATGFGLSAYVQDNGRTDSCMFDLEIFPGNANVGTHMAVKSYVLRGDASANGFTTGFCHHGTDDVPDAVRLIFNTGTANGPWVLYGIV